MKPTKNCKHRRKHTSCASSIAIATTKKIRTIKPIHHPTEQFDKNQGRIKSTWQVHILRSPLMDHIQLSTSIKRYIIIRFESTTTVDEPSERSRCSSPYTIASPSTHTKHTSLCTTQTKVMGNHRMHPQEIIIYIIRTSRKIKNLIAKRDEEFLAFHILRKPSRIIYIIGRSRQLIK